MGEFFFNFLVFKNYLSSSFLRRQEDRKTTLKLSELLSSQGGSVVEHQLMIQEVTVRYQSGHMPGLPTKSPVVGVQEAANQ